MREVAGSAAAHGAGGRSSFTRNGGPVRSAQVAFCSSVMMATTFAIAAFDGLVRLLPHPLGVLQGPLLDDRPRGAIWSSSSWTSRNFATCSSVSLSRSRTGGIWKASEAGVLDGDLVEALDLLGA